MKVTNTTIIQEKLDQAVIILNELGIDAWMTFVRETSLTPDPCLDLIAGMDMVWQSAFIVTRTGERIAIVGLHDVENVKQLEAYTRVESYVQGISQQLKDILLEINPSQIALNYSVNDVAADGLGHGLMLLLKEHLSDTDFASRFISAEKIIDMLRGQKSRAEITRIKQAITTTQDIFKQVTEYAAPGKSEKDIADYIHNILSNENLGTAWDKDYCPTVSCGPASPIGHAGPLPDYSVQPGTLMHMDFGVKQDGFCADLQRVWYVREQGETSIPDQVVKAFDASRKALLAGFKALKPGAQGWQVDEAARSTLTAEGYPAYQFAFGHHIGRVAHDGATVLGPRWERYGNTPFGVISEGNVFAIELGVIVEDYGYVGLEENVLVTEHGAKWLSEPQTEIWTL